MSGNPKPNVPLSVRRWAIVGAAAIFLTFGGVGAWAALAPLQGAVVAGGVLTVEAKRRLIQHLEGGIVARIAVRDGDSVMAGDTLIVLSDARAAATLSIVEVALRQERALEARLLAERDGLAEIAFPPSLAADPSPEAQALMAAHRNVFQTRAKTRAGAEEILIQRIAQLDRESEGLAAQERAKAGQQELIDDEILGVQSLYDSGQATKQRLLALKRARLDLEGERGDLVASIARVEKAIGETRLEILQRTLDFQREVAEGLEGTQTEIRDLEERAIAARDVLMRLEIKAPTDGVIVNLAVNTLGAVVRPGETVLEIVPTGERLFVELRIRTQDVDSVTVGQPARVRLLAFNARTTPELRGNVVYLSADSLSDPENNATFYVARVGLDDDELGRLGDKVLQPGMPAEVFIETGARTAVEYLARPMMDSVNRAWREP